MPFSDISTIRTALANGAWGEWMPYAETTEVLTGLGEGITGVKVQAKDQHGVVSDIYTVRILIDSTAPTINSLMPVNKATAGKGSIGLNINATDNYCEQLQYNYGAGWYDLTGAVTVPLTGGLNTINLQVRDDSGNITSKTITVWGL